MTTEQQAAVERLRNDSYEKDAAGDYTESGWSMRGCDESEVASLYLAEHRPDDGEPISGEYLISLGMTKSHPCDGSMLFEVVWKPTPMSWSSVKWSPVDRCVFFNGFPLPHITTHGQFRKLIAAINIPLTEETVTSEELREIDRLTADLREARRLLKVAIGTHPDSPSVVAMRQRVADFLASTAHVEPTGQVAGD